MLEIIGWIGGVSLALCGVPLAIETFKLKTAKHINLPFLVLWALGEICTLVYVISNGDRPLIFNYVFNLLTLLIVFWYKAKDFKA